MTGSGLLEKGHGAETSAELASEELSRLLEVSQGLSESLDFEMVLAKVVAAARDLLGTDMSTLLLLDESGDFLRMEAQAGIDARIAKRLSTPMGENLAGRAAASGEAVRCTDIAIDERSNLSGICDGHIRSALLVPLIRNGRTLGALGVETREIRDFDDHDEGILRLLADHAATAIETSRLYTVEHDQVERLQSLVERVNDQNTAMRRTREAHDRLAEAALEGSGLAALTTVLEDLVPAPLTVVNQFGARLCGGDSEEADELWESCRESTAFGRGLDRMRSNAGLASPDAGPQDGFWRIVGIVAAGEVLGAIVVLDTRGSRSTTCWSSRRRRTSSPPSFSASAAWPRSKRAPMAT